jgi:sterol desaturase/sphingolipid hydroxylase (fatty acid hydroxylase superfamily)
MLLVALPAVLLFSLLEAWVLSRRQAYDWKSMGVSVTDLLLRVAVGIFLPLSIVAPLVSMAWKHRYTTLELDTWQAIALLFLAQEFCYYGYHRAAHRVRWFWCNHAVHHSPNALNLAAAYRIGIFGKLTGVSFFFLPMIWLGFAPRVVFATLTLNLLYQFWLHATWIPKLGWMEHVFNTPSAHRVHHAANLDYLDANYGGVLIVFDRLFGTYKPERADLPCRYGLVQPQTSYNPLRVELDEWRKLGRDLLAARSLGALLGHLFRPPGWQPGGSGLTTEDLRARQAPPQGDSTARTPVTNTATNASVV